MNNEFYAVIKSYTEIYFLFNWHMLISLLAPEQRSHSLFLLVVRHPLLLLFLRLKVKMVKVVVMEVVMMKMEL